MGLSKLLVNGIINFIKLLSRLVFEINVVDDCIYHKFSESKHILLVLYVDNILLASNDIGLLHETKRFLAKKFEMKDLGDASFMLGIQMHMDGSRGILRLSQNSYIEKVLKRFGMQDCKLGDTPVAKGDKFNSVNALRFILRLKKCRGFLMRQLSEVLCMLKFIWVWILRIFLGC